MIAAEMPGGYDLHTHSVFSDGTTSPASIAHEAVAAELEGFALTDHDTVAGWEEARIAAASVGIDFLPGIELTTHTGVRSAHLLAYGPDPLHLGLGAKMTMLRDSRVARARAMADLLAVDFDIDWDAVLLAAGSSVGRPHIADALVAAGFAENRSAVFETILSPRGPYYMPIYALGTLEAVELVRSAGGLPVLGHPAANRMRTPFSAGELGELTEAGLWGIELDHPENRGDWVAPLRDAAEALGLVVTGASDYHGSGKANRLGERRTSADVVAEIRDHVTVPR